MWYTLGTLKTTQAFFTAALCAFADHLGYTSHSQLRIRALDFLDQQCCEKVLQFYLEDARITTI